MRAIRSFRRSRPASSEDGTPGDSKTDDDGEKLSPVAGQNSWLVVGAEYSVTFISRTLQEEHFLGLELSSKILQELQCSISVLESGIF